MVRVHPRQPLLHAPVAQRIEHRASNAEVAGEIPAGSTTQDFPGVAQCRGNELRPRSVRVQVLPPGPLSLPWPNAAPKAFGVKSVKCRCRFDAFHLLKALSLSKGKSDREYAARECKEPRVSSFKRVLAGASPATGTFFTTGRVAQSAEAQRRERCQCWFDSSRDYHFSELEALAAKQPPFKRSRRVRLPTGSFQLSGSEARATSAHCRFESCPPLTRSDSQANFLRKKFPTSFAVVRSEFLRNSAGRVRV